MIEQSDEHLKSATKLVGVNARNNLVSPSTGPVHLRLILVLILTNTVSPLIHIVAVKFHFQIREAAWPSGSERWCCNPEVPGSRPPPCH